MKPSSNASAKQRLGALLKKASNIRSDIRGGFEVLFGTIMRLAEKRTALGHNHQGMERVSVSTQTDGRTTDSENNWVRPEDITPSFAWFKSNEGRHWPRPTFQRVVEERGEMADAQELVQAYAGRDSGAGLPGPLSPTPSKSSLGAVSSVRGRTSTDDPERHIYIISIRDGPGRPADEEPSFGASSG